MELSKGDIVRHPARSEWGLGRVLAVGETHWTIYFLDAQENNPKKIATTFPLQMASPDEDVRILQLPPDGELLNGKPATPMTFQEATRPFEERYPLWFEDPSYVDGERASRWKAHELASETLNQAAMEGLLQGQEYEEIVRRAVEVCTLVDLLSKFEIGAVQGALKTGEGKRVFSVALGELLHGRSPAQARFEQFKNALSSLPAGRSKLSKWPVQTLLPFLVFPEREIFLKPGATQAAARRLGFKLNYRSEPNWLTYNGLLKLSQMLLRRLSQYGPRDLIDVQSFICHVGSAQPRPGASALKA